MTNDANEVRDAELAVDRAWEAAADPKWRDGRHRSTVLLAIAEGLERRRAEIIDCAGRESALTHEELAPEFSRMVGTLRLFARVIADDSWRRPSICSPGADPSTSIGPNHDVRSVLVPRRGVAIVFGASNFPLAYGVCGGDTASALAAGLPVVVKEHPGHRQTGRLLAGVAREAIRARAVCSAVLGYANEAEREGEFEVARALVLHECAAAVGFTGSFAGGMAIEKLALSKTGGAIPVYAEMGSTNPVFVTRAALEKRGEAIASEIAASLLARHGQQCTCPGLVLIESSVLLPAIEREQGRHDEVADGFERVLARHVEAATSRRMLTPRVREGFVRQTNRIASHLPEVERLALGTVACGSDEREAPAMLFRVDIDELRTLRFLSEEAFGPSSIVSRFSASRADMVEDLLGKIEGHLVACLYAEREELEDAASYARKLMTRLMDVAGRVVINGVPTGVRVCEAMVHSGPFPACNAPETTAVGPRALERWCRPVCLQNWPVAALPEVLRG